MSLAGPLGSSEAFLDAELIVEVGSSSVLPSVFDGVVGAVLTDMAVLVGGLDEVTEPELSGRSVNVGTAFLDAVGDGLGRPGEAGAALGDCGGERGAIPWPKPLVPSLTGGGGGGLGRFI